MRFEMFAQSTQLVCAKLNGKANADMEQEGRASGGGGSREAGSQGGDEQQSLGLSLTLSACARKEEQPKQRGRLD
jgi:hypothetical protein